MKTERLGVAAAMGIAFAIAVACGPDVEEKPKSVEHRISPCTQICKSMQSPECGNVTHPKFPQFSSVDACVESCANPELENWWGGPQEDGEDACLDDWNAYASCVAALACEQQYEHWNASRVSDYPCKAEQDSQVLCGQSHPIPEAG